MKIKRLIGGNLQSNGYIIYQNEGGLCFIVDPGYNADSFMKLLKKLNLTPSKILLTHHHYDHVGAVSKLRKEFGCAVCLHAGDSDIYGDIVDEHLEDGDILLLDSEEIKVVHTPGHTRGGVCYFSEKSKLAFTGDTIFNVDLGRTDLSDGSESDMVSSILNIIDNWSNEVTIYPGHGDHCTMKYVRKSNPEFLDIISSVKTPEIKLIALDLDGTTLNTQGLLSVRTELALKSAIAKGVYIIVATGRSLSAIPDNILKFKGLQYIITSNGANVVDLETGHSIYTNFIDSLAIVEVVHTLKKYNYMLEVFIRGHAYVEKSIYDNIENIGLTQRHVKYIRETRQPIEDLYAFMLKSENISSIENININFTNPNDKLKMWEILPSIKNITLTSSLEHNIEIGGYTTHKADAVKFICKHLGINKSNIMACGDSPNDGTMLKFSALPIAVGNAKVEIKKISSYITDTNDNDGVAKAIEKFILSK